VYAGGDIVTGAATVIEAMGAGRRAARNMKAFLGLRDTDFIYQEQPGVAASTLFGIERAEHGYVRVRSPR
jgi:glutamate synthase (NADPH/NADH) small chain